MPIENLRQYYWRKEELVRFARELGLKTTGRKLDILGRIEKFLRGAPEPRSSKGSQRSSPRDSEHTLTPEAPVINFKSDQKTREFFQSIIGPSFHFTAHLNQFIAANDGLRYRDLVAEWLAEKERRKSPGYRPPIMKSCEYNRFIRDYFADGANRGKSFRDAVAAWNEVKRRRGPRKYGSSS